MSIYVCWLLKSIVRTTADIFLAPIPIVVFASFEGGSWILSNSCVARNSNYLSICTIVAFKEDEAGMLDTASLLA